VKTKIRTIIESCFKSTNLIGRLDECNTSRRKFFHVFKMRFTYFGNLEKFPLTWRFLCFLGHKKRRKKKVVIKMGFSKMIELLQTKNKY